MGIIADFLRYSIEFFKVVLIVVNIFGISVKKRINWVYGLSVVVVVLLSWMTDIFDRSLYYAVIIFIVLFIVLYEKKKIGFVVLAYFGISFVDMILGIVYTYVFDITYEDMASDFALAAFNSITLVMLAIIAFVRTKKGKSGNMQKYIVDRYIPFILIGVIYLSFYLTCIQFIGFGYTDVNYNEIFITCSFVFIVVFSFISCLLFFNKTKNKSLVMENEINQQLIKSQNDYYAMMLKKDNETKLFRHDIKEHIICIQMMHEQKRCEELGEYLKQMDEYMRELSPKHNTGNMYVDIVLTDIEDRYPDVNMNWTGVIPEISIQSMDICTLFYNLMKNAFEAAGECEEKWVDASVKVYENSLVIELSNSYKMIKKDSRNRFVTTKNGKNHGYGLKNIEKIVGKYKGEYKAMAEEKVFCTYIIIPQIVKLS